MRFACLLVISSLALYSGLLTAAEPSGGRSPTDTKSGYRLGERLPQKGAPESAATYKEVKWEALVPADWNPMKLFQGINLGMLNDGDPRAMRALERLREEWDKAPANASMNGARVRIPGFVVPLEKQGGQVTEFLLVPYFGACIHTPPPPANQIIHVFTDKPVKNMQTMDAMWVSGVLETARSETGMGAAGYRMKGEVLVPYKEPRK